MIKLAHNKNRDFCLLNLTDPQLKAQEWDEGNKTGNIFKKTVETLIRRVSPDLITLSGDLSYAGDLSRIKILQIILIRLKFRGPVASATMIIRTATGSCKKSWMNT